jgi:hypothetical protein
MILHTASIKRLGWQQIAGTKYTRSIGRTFGARACHRRQIQQERAACGQGESDGGQSATTVAHHEV